MKTLKMIFILFAVISNITGTNAQQYSLGEISVIKPTQVIASNYTVINLSKEIVDDPAANNFDVTNPYTYLQIVNDPQGTGYHILLQTNFWGKILFLSYSNNLSAVFNKAGKPIFMFTRCLKDINNHISPVQMLDAVLKCIISRLEYSSDY